MLEVPLPSHWQIRDCCHFTGCNLEPAIAAAACLLAQPDSQEVHTAPNCISALIGKPYDKAFKESGSLQSTDPHCLPPALNLAVAYLNRGLKVLSEFCCQSRVT